MAAVVFELRQCLTLAGIEFDDCEAIDRVFVECFDEVYANLSGSGLVRRTFGPGHRERPVDELASWHERYDGFHSNRVLGQGVGEGLSPLAEGAGRVFHLHWIHPDEDHFEWINSDGEGSDPPPSRQELAAGRALLRPMLH